MNNTQVKVQLHATFISGEKNNLLWLSQYAGSARSSYW